MGCEYLLFGPDRKLISRAAVTGRMAGAGEPYEAHVAAMFARDSNLMILLSQKIGSSHAMYRILLNAAVAYLRSLTNAQTLLKAGIRTKNFWLRTLL